MKILVVGSGISGATIARGLAANNHEITVIDKNDHIGGNCYDYFDENGIDIHLHGTHIFHTDDKKVWNFLSQFTQWYPYMHKVLALVDGQLVPIPFNLNSIEQIFPPVLANRLIDKLLSHFTFNTKVPILKLMQTGDEDLLFLAEFIYEKVFLRYTLKQWGLRPEELDPSVTARVPVSVSRDNRYFQNIYQGVPLHGYTEMINRMLDHENICICLQTPYDQRMYNKYDRIYYTGPIDEFFSYKFGELPYRSLKFDFLSFDRPYFQCNSVINYPYNYDFTRIGEYKYFLGTISNKTVVSYEYPQNFLKGQNERYYPIPSNANQDLYCRYLKEAKQYTNKVTFLGRLGDYKYYDMDRAVSRALDVLQLQNDLS